MILTLYVLESELLEVIGKLPSGVQVTIVSGEDIEAECPQKGDKVMLSYKGTFWGGPGDDTFCEIICLELSAGFTYHVASF